MSIKIGKSYKISSRKILYFRSYQPKASRVGGGRGRGGDTPSAFRVKTEG